MENKYYNMLLDFIHHYKAIIEILFPPYIFCTSYQKYAVVIHEELLRALCILQLF